MDNAKLGGGGERFRVAPPWLTRIDHTADEGIVVTAPDPGALFARAAWGMFSILTDLSRVQARERSEVVVEAPDVEALLVRWLSELNYRHVTERRVYCQFEVAEVDGTRLRGTAAGERIRPGRHRIHCEIKAVTFHGLRVEQTADGWRAAVIFDV